MCTRCRMQVQQDGQSTGLQLCYDNRRTLTFYSTQPLVLKQWADQLRQHLNQVGFHQYFKPIRKLGKGNFASVYEVERFSDGQRFAVKAFSKQSLQNAKNGRESLMNQLGVMRSLSHNPHSNILRLEGVYESDNSIYVVLELLEGGQLFHRIQERRGKFSPEEVRQFMVGLLQGLQHMHGLRLIHRDLKPENIMLRWREDNLSPVIVDFGLATHADIQKYLFFRCGTPGYVAPEIIALSESSHIQPQCDIFSAGVIFHILLTRKQLFEGVKYDQVYKKNKEMNINLLAPKYNEIDPIAMNLLERMLRANPEQRITAEQALKHCYFTGVLEQEDIEEKQVSPCLTEAESKGIKWL